MKRLKLTTYPYTYARVSAMISKLIPKPEYHKLLKMGLNEIIKYLEEGEYRNEVNKLAVAYKGIELMERSLNLNLVNTFNKLRRISEAEVRYLIEAYLARWDFYNLKTILRAIYSKADTMYAESLLIPAGSYGKEFFVNLLRLNSIEQVLKKTEFIDFNAIKNAVESFKEKNNLIEVENALDRIYYKNMLELTLIIPKEGFLIKDFIMNEIDIINLKIILRLKKIGFKKDDILKLLIFEGARLNKKLLEDASNAKDIEDLMLILKKTYYKNFFEKGVGDSMIELELALDNHLLKRSTLSIHQHPLTITAILSYMFFKEIEVKNLKTLIKAKQLGIEDEVIEKKLLV